MLKIIHILPKRQILKGLKLYRYHNLRTFLSEAYYCEEAWNRRLNSPLLQKVVLEDLYYELDQRFHKSRQLNALDVDIFVNAVQSDAFCDELFDIVHKLRLTADTGVTPESTSHAVVRVLLRCGKTDELLNVLDDRLNYGVFLDYYTANLLMDSFWKSKEYAKGARVASQLMLQEELEHPLACDLALLHCYNYLLHPQGWPEYVPLPEPEEEVKVRVKYLRNPYDDEHFDLRDPQKIIGKTLTMISKNKNDPLHQSFHILGLALFGKIERVKELCGEISHPLHKNILNLVPKDNEVKDLINQLKTETTNVEEILIENVNKTYQKTSETDISEQCKILEKWENERIKSMEIQKARLNSAKRLKNIEDLKQALKAKEEKLWFFENEEQIDLAIESKTKFYPKRWFGHKKKPKLVDAGYVPPEVQNKPIGKSNLS